MGRTALGYLQDLRSHGENTTATLEEGRSGVGIMERRHSHMEGGADSEAAASGRPEEQSASKAGEEVKTLVPGCGFAA